MTPTPTDRKTSMPPSAPGHHPAKDAPLHHLATMRRGLLVTALGLLVQFVPLFHWTPMSFIVAAAIGLPLVLLGSLFFVLAVVRTWREQGAL